ncbi:MAG TPA: hydroxyethylthiazole kinase [Methanoregulaceae archaeon]|nr:hydroxyethylthiazole kinase [Methanoregulaceae archaeon]
MNESVYTRIFEDIRSRRPLVHHITNYVTVNDAANITLCAGGAPVMAHAVAEVEEMVMLAGALVLNTGTPDPVQVDAMFLAGRAAESAGIPIVLDPVGAGATRYRTDLVKSLMDELHITVIKGNQGEIGILSGADAKVRGVDSDGISGDPITITREFAKSRGITVAMSGPTDVVSDGERILLIGNGDPLMGCISGTGCMAASVTGACIAVSSDPLAAAATGLSLLGVAGERAARRTSGPGSFKTALFDELSALTPDEFGRELRINNAQDNGIRPVRRNR